MDSLQELEILLLELIDKHPTLNDTYRLTRFFAKSSILPDKLYQKLNDLASEGYLSIKSIKNTIKSYKLTESAKVLLDKFNTYDYLEAFTFEIDPTGFIAKIVFMLENKRNLAEVTDSFLLSDGRLIAFLNSPRGKLNDSTVLQNAQKKEWIVKQYAIVFGTVETRKKIEQEEQENTFQYLIGGIGHSDKPEKGEIFKIIKNIS